MAPSREKPTMKTKRHSTVSRPGKGKYGFLFSGSVGQSPAVNPRDGDPCLLAKIDRRLIQVSFGSRGPQVELVALGSASEASPGMFAQVGRKRAAVRVGRTVQRTRPAKLLAVGLGRYKPQQLEYCGQCDLLSNQGIINTWHQTPHGNREEESVLL